MSQQLERAMHGSICLLIGIPISLKGGEDKQMKKGCVNSKDHHKHIDFRVYCIQPLIKIGIMLNSFRGWYVKSPVTCNKIHLNLVYTQSRWMGSGGVSWLKVTDATVMKVTVSIMRVYFYMTAGKLSWASIQPNGFINRISGSGGEAFIYILPMLRCPRQICLAAVSLLYLNIVVGDPTDTKLSHYRTV